MKTIKQILIDRDGMKPKEADHLIQQARSQMFKYLEEGNFEAAENICGEYFGLEPDYIEQLI